ncbi:MAG: hypothetical protein D6753_17500, partial [Planctomycetota bacterium]
LDVACGSALECAAIQDVLSATGGLDDARHRELKSLLQRVVSMLTRLIARADAVFEPAVEYECRDAEYEYEGANELQWRSRGKTKATSVGPIRDAWFWSFCDF